MTLASDIIGKAYRKTNLISLGTSPNANQISEALDILNGLILFTLGNEAGDPLLDLNYGGDYDQSNVIDQWIPDNVRLVLNLSAATEIDLDPEPYDGQRFSIVDVAGNLSTYNLTINGNGRNIEGASSLVVNTDDTVKQWLYRADTGNWVVLEELIESDPLPFPEEFDQYFVLMLAAQLNPTYGQTLALEHQDLLRSLRGRLRARYLRRTFDIQTDPGLVNPNDAYYGNYSNWSFNTGKLWPWRT